MSASWPSSIRTTPTAHAEAKLRLAVSKSIAVKLTGTVTGYCWTQTRYERTAGCCRKLTSGAAAVQTWTEA
ncbi:hypothetical protein GCM10009824_02340 [Kocuria atrinae]|uniref:Uncharacterized protein n=1 Tax=Kocuria atrinae TaxID=592377 RepID=A0ABN2XE39_9MICC